MISSNLSRRVDCRLQMGGSDQWGNIVNGVDLGRRMGTPQLFALTTPLLTTASGEKMGKTAQGAVWLNADQFSPYDFWQYWRNTEDADVVQVPETVHDAADERDRQAGGAAGRGDQRGQEGAGGRRDRAAAWRAKPPNRRRKPRGRLSRKARSPKTFPRWKFPAANSKPGSACWRCFVKAGLVASNGEARRQIKGGGLRVNDVAVTDEKMMLKPSDLTPEGVIKLSLGKKRHVLLKPA